MKMTKRKKFLAAAAVVLACAQLTACSSGTTSSSSSSSTSTSSSSSAAGSESSSSASSGLMSNEEIIKAAAAAGKVGNWGLGNEYEIQALLTKYGLPTDYITMDFTMDQFDTDAVTLASAMTYNELGLVKNSYDGGYSYGDTVGIIDMNNEGVFSLVFI